MLIYNEIINFPDYVIIPRYNSHAFHILIIHMGQLMNYYFGNVVVFKLKCALPLNITSSPPAH